MSTEVTVKPECQSASVTKTESVESSDGSENMTINPGNDFLYVCAESYLLLIECERGFDKRKIKILETRVKPLLKIIKSGNTKIDDIAVLAQTYHNICLAYFKSNEKGKLNIIRESIQHCLYWIKDKELDCKFILIALHTHYLLSNVYSQLKKMDNATQQSDKVIELYWTYLTKKDEYGTPIDLQDIVLKSTTKSDTYASLHLIYTRNLYTWVAEQESLGQTNDLNFILRCHLLLTALLSRMFECTEHLVWIERTMLLCRFFLKHDYFAEALNQLVRASFVKRTILKVMTIKARTQQKSSLEKSELEDLDEQNTIAEKLVLSHWAKYGIALLRMSAKRLLRLEEGNSLETNNLVYKFSSISANPLASKILYPEFIDEYSVANMHHPIMNKYILDYAGAKEMFTLVLRFIEDAHISNSDNEFTDNYVINALDICNAYKYMAIYEQDTSKQIQMHNRRIIILSETLEFVCQNRKFSRDVVNYLRIQLAIAYSNVIEVYSEELEIESSPFTQRDKRIDNPITEGIAKGLMQLRNYMKRE